MVVLSRGALRRDDRTVPLSRMTTEPSPCHEHLYNVGKLKEAPFPLSGSKTGRNSVYGGTSNNSIPQSNGVVNVLHKKIEGAAKSVGVAFLMKQREKNCLIYILMQELFLW